jgi:acylphosphatase
MPVTICRRYTVNGLVQGVFYRASARDQALTNGLRGRVRNTSNGDVEVIACGDVESLEKFERWLRVGPPAARVTRLAVAEIPLQRFSGFSISD